MKKKKEIGFRKAKTMSNPSTNGFENRNKIVLSKKETKNGDKSSVLVHENGQLYLKKYSYFISNPEEAVKKFCTKDGFVLDKYSPGLVRLSNTFSDEKVAVWPYTNEIEIYSTEKVCLVHKMKMRKYYHI